MHVTESTNSSFHIYKMPNHSRWLWRIKFIIW